MAWGIAVDDRVNVLGVRVKPQSRAKIGERNSEWLIEGATAARATTPVLADQRERAEERKVARPHADRSASQR